MHFGGPQSHNGGANANVPRLAGAVLRQHRTARDEWRKARWLRSHVGTQLTQRPDNLILSACVIVSRAPNAGCAPRLTCLAKHRVIYEKASINHAALSASGHRQGARAQHHTRHDHRSKGDAQRPP